MIEERDANSLVGPLVLRALSAIARAFHRFLEDLQGAAIVAERLSRRREIAGSQRVPLAQLHGIDAERLRDALHMDFHRELRLRGAEAAEGAVGRRVREHRAAADPRVRTAIRSSRMDAAPR